MDLKKATPDFERLINEIISKKINLLRNPSTEKSLYDFKESKENYYLTTYNNSYLQLKKALQELLKERNRDPKELIAIQTIIKNLEISYQTNDLEGMKRQIAIISALPQSLPKKFSINLKKIPPAIKDEIEADMIELEKCYSTGCYRSSVILCGRILETALHSKYYEETGFDLLEKNPGIGLGNLIAKLKEKNIQLVPGITEQIHLINNIRTFSVHKKKEVFEPSEQQTLAIILFTLDSVEKLFP